MWREERARAAASIWGATRSLDLAAAAANDGQWGRDDDHGARLSRLIWPRILRAPFCSSAALLVLFVSPRTSLVRAPERDAPLPLTSFTLVANSQNRLVPSQVAGRRWLQRRRGCTIELATLLSRQPSELLALRAQFGRKLSGRAGDRFGARRPD